MALAQTQTEKVTVRLARDAAEIDAAQHLRYRVFYEEYKATPSAEMQKTRRDFDAYDDITDHLIVIDENIADPQQRIVGTYRLLRREAADKFGKFYTSDEFDIVSLLNSGATLLELGRSCVLAEYRTRPVLQLLWQGITDYMLDHQIGLMFGCASFPGTDVNAIAEQLSYLHHFHLAPTGLRPRALDNRFVDMNLIPAEKLDPKRVFASLPPLIKGYLRLGAMIGDGAVIDHAFNTTDVLVVLPIASISSRYVNYYGADAGRFAS